MQKRTAKSEPCQSPCADGLLRPYPDAAQFLGVGRSKIFEYLANGTLPFVRVADDAPRRIPKRALVAYLDARLVERSS